MISPRLLPPPGLRGDKLIDIRAQIRPVEKNEMRSCERIMQDTFRFEAIDIIPAWQMFTAARHGGLVLGAFVKDELVGFSFAFPAFDGKVSYLFSSGLCVSASHESLGIGSLLKREQGIHAKAMGYEAIRWTVEPLSSKALYLYLSKLGAELVGYSRELYEEFKLGGADGGIVADEAEICWRLNSLPGNQTTHPRNITCITESEKAAGGVRRLTSVAPLQRSRHPIELEVPWDLEQLKEQSLEIASSWRRQIREVITELIDSGYRGIEVRLDRVHRRSFIVFANRESPSQLWQGRRDGDRI